MLCRGLDRLDAASSQTLWALRPVGLRLYDTKITPSVTYDTVVWMQPGLMGLRPVGHRLYHMKASPAVTYGTNV